MSIQSTVREFHRIKFIHFSYNKFGNILHEWNNHRISKLFVSLSIRDYNFKAVRKSLQSCTFPWCKSSRISPRLRNKDFRAILVIPGA
jgi:hypothetical protein